MSLIHAAAIGLALTGITAGELRQVIEAEWLDQLERPAAAGSTARTELLAKGWPLRVFSAPGERVNS